MLASFGACDIFVRNLKRSNLLDPAQMDEVVQKFMKQALRAEPQALADHLVSQGLLTPFQAERLVSGDQQELVVGPYILTDVLGYGSMGAVYKATSKNAEGGFVVKVSPRRSTWNVLLAKRQVQAFRQVVHPAVVTFMDVGSAGNQHFLVWPLVEGVTIDRIIQREGKIHPGVAAHYCMQIAEGLQVCHQNELFHGLLKPSNLLIDEQHQAHILDFGIGAILSQVEENEQSMINTQGQTSLMSSALDCACPESISDPKNLTPSGDQYSLGCVLYFCLTGRYPFEGDAVKKMLGHQAETPPPIREFCPEVRPELEAVVEQLMHKRPDHRFANAGAVVEALQPLTADPARVRRKSNSDLRIAALNLPSDPARPQKSPGSKQGLNESASFQSDPVQSPLGRPQKTPGSRPGVNAPEPARPQKTPGSRPGVNAPEPARPQKTSGSKHGENAPQPPARPQNLPGSRQGVSSREPLQPEAAPRPQRMPPSKQGVAPRTPDQPPARPPQKLPGSRQGMAQPPAPLARPRKLPGSKQGRGAEEDLEDFDNDEPVARPQKLPGSRQGVRPATPVRPQKTSASKQGIRPRRREEEYDHDDDEMDRRMILGLSPLAFKYALIMSVILVGVIALKVYLSMG